MKKKIPRRLGKLLLVFNTTLFIISLSISFTFLLRSIDFYHIDYVDIDKSKEITEEEKDKSYNEVVDYLAHNKSLETGKIKYSNDNKEHFIDFNTFFIITFSVLGVTSFILLIKRRFFRNIKIRNHNIRFYSSIVSIFIAIISSIITLIIGFDKMFDLISFVFSLGHNFELDVQNNEIIESFPRDFFVDCATFIVFLIIFISVIIIVREIIKLKREKKDDEVLEPSEPLKQ